MSFVCATDDKLLIRWTAGQCLKRVPLDRRIRLLGVRVSNLEPTTRAEMDLQAQAILGLDCPDSQILGG